MVRVRCPAQMFIASGNGASQALGPRHFGIPQSNRCTVYGPSVGASPRKFKKSLGQQAVPLTFLLESKLSPHDHSKGLSRRQAAFSVAWAASLLLSSQESQKAFADEDQPPAVGTLAPDFTLEGKEGPVTLSDLRGKWVVLYFYPADFTPGCTLEARRFQDDYPKFLEHNAEIIGVSVDDVASHDSFCATHGLRFPLLADTSPAGQVSKLYGSYLDFKFGGGSMRHTFLIDPEGKIRSVFLKVRPAVHSEQVLELLTQLQLSPGAPS
mmetsp:Transcript_11912/g.20697  ORF Transcript_11912/g.20697 Transcript_11912/m.20697 type:complete len:267 (-) Transcript_11912:546-1346(-)